MDVDEVGVEELMKFITKCSPSQVEVNGFNSMRQAMQAGSVTPKEQFLHLIKAFTDGVQHGNWPYFTKTK